MKPFGRFLARIFGALLLVVALAVFAWAVRSVSQRGGGDPG